METIDGIATRQKIYNKMVQMLECKSVRESIGCHWKDWVCQHGTRLADARDKSSNRGLSRAEVTFYIKNDTIPTDQFIEETLQNITNYIPTSLVYSTPFSNVWSSYCDIFCHSLVCIDRSEDVGLIVYSYNDITGNISGHCVEKWSEREKWCLDKLTLNGNLPLDVIDINLLRKTTSITNSQKKKDTVIDISGSRYFKINPDNSTKFTTRLVTNKGVYSFNKETVEVNAKLLEKAGFVEHDNCIPYLGTSKGTKASKADAELRKVDSLQINIFARKIGKNGDKVIETILHDEAVRLDEIRKPILIELSSKEAKMKHIKGYTIQFCTRNSIHLRDLKQGMYDVMAAKKYATRFGDSYKLLLQLEDHLSIVWSNTYITNTIKSIPTESLQHILDYDSGFLTLYNKPLATLTVTGRGTNQYGHISVYCNFSLNEIRDENTLSYATHTTISEIASCKEQLSVPVKKASNKLPIVTREELLPYREYENLTTLPVGSIHKVTAIGYISHYGTERLVIQITDKFYQAGQDLEEKADQLIKDSVIKIGKIRINRDRHIKYAVCSIYEQDDWAAMVDYAKTPMLSKLDGSTCVVDVKSVDIKGVKRKLLLTNNGEVYKLKRSKLEETISPGFI